MKLVKKTESQPIDFLPNELKPLQTCNVSCLCSVVSQDSKKNESIKNWEEREIGFPISSVDWDCGNCCFPDLQVLMVTSRCYCFQAEYFRQSAWRVFRQNWAKWMINICRCRGRVDFTVRFQQLLCSGIDETLAEFVFWDWNKNRPHLVCSKILKNKPSHFVSGNRVFSC